MPQLSTQEKKWLRRRTSKDLIKDIDNLGWMMSNAIEQQIAQQMTREDSDLVLFNSATACNAIIAELHTRGVLIIANEDLQLLEVPVNNGETIKAFRALLDRIDVKK